jgi:2-polyprenyl-6-hydroxyphenyl methylase/3-demethylubiquinone-9 3-methyltransferase
VRESWAVTDAPARQRNDPAQYDDLAEQWWDPGGTFAMLHWIAAARGALVPVATRPGAVLIDIGCGGGLLAPHVAGLGYTHIGVDLTASALRHARQHDVVAVRGDVAALPLPDGIADVVCAGEILEHVSDVPATLAEACRVLRPGGWLVLDTIAATALARLVVVRLAERIPGAAPPGLHDPDLFVDPRVVRSCCGDHGVEVTLRGLRPAAGQSLSWLLRRRSTVQMVPTRSKAILFQAYGRKEGT